MAPCPNIKPTRHSLELAIFHIQAMAQQAEEGAITLEFSPWRGQCWENGEKKLLKSKHHTEIIGDIGVIDDMICGCLKTVGLPQCLDILIKKMMKHQICGTLISDKTKMVNSSKRLSLIYDNCGLSWSYTNVLGISMYFLYKHHPKPLFKYHKNMLYTQNMGENKMEIWASVSYLVCNPPIVPSTGRIWSIKGGNSGKHLLCTRQCLSSWGQSQTMDPDIFMGWLITTAGNWGSS